MRIYLAATYARREELADKADVLRSLGHEVTSRWLNGTHGKDYESITPEERSWAATEDVEDIEAADSFVVFADGRGRGGKHVEFGIALSRGLTLYLIGQPEHVFHWLPEVHHFDGWSRFIDHIARPFVDTTGAP